MGGENRKIPIFCWFCWPRLISRELCFMGYPGENRRLSEDTVSTLEMHHAFRQQFRAELAGSLKHEKATGWLSRRSKGENSLLSSKDRTCPIFPPPPAILLKEVNGRLRTLVLDRDRVRSWMAWLHGVRKEYTALQRGRLFLSAVSKWCQTEPKQLRN